MSLMVQASPMQLVAPDSRVANPIVAGRLAKNGIEPVEAGYICGRVGC